MKTIKNKYIKQLFEEKKLLVAYVRDDLGFRCGAVIALKQDDGTFILGVSRVHPNDYEYISGSLIGTPAVQKFLSDFERDYNTLVSLQGICLQQGKEEDAAIYLAKAQVMEKIQPQLNHLLYNSIDSWSRKYLDNEIGCGIAVPAFDRETAILKAIKNGKEKTQVVFTNTELEVALLKMSRRASSYFSKE